MNSRRSGLDSANATNSSSLIAAKRGRKARLNVGTRTAGAGISSMKCISVRILARSTGSCGVKFADSGMISSRYSIMTEEWITIARRDHAVRIELQVIRLELIAGKKVELDLGEGEFLGVEHETDALTAGR